MQSLSKLPKKHKQYPESQYYLGESYAKQLEDKKALKAFNQAIDYPRGKYYYNSLWRWSQISFKKGKNKELKRRLDILQGTKEYEQRATTLLNMLESQY